MDRLVECVLGLLHYFKLDTNAGPYQKRFKRNANKIIKAKPKSDKVSP